MCAAGRADREGPLAEVRGPWAKAWQEASSTAQALDTGHGWQVVGSSRWPPDCRGQSEGSQQPAAVRVLQASSRQLRPLGWRPRAPGACRLNLSVADGYPRAQDLDSGTSTGGLLVDGPMELCQRGRRRPRAQGMNTGTSTGGLLVEGFQHGRPARGRAPWSCVRAGLGLRPGSTQPACPISFVRLG